MAIITDKKMISDIIDYINGSWGYDSDPLSKEDALYINDSAEWSDGYCDTCWTTTTGIEIHYPENEFFPGMSIYRFTLDIAQVLDWIANGKPPLSEIDVTDFPGMKDEIKRLIGDRHPGAEIVYVGVEYDDYTGRYTVFSSEYVDDEGNSFYKCHYDVSDHIVRKITDYVLSERR